MIYLKLFFFTMGASCLFVIALSLVKYFSQPPRPKVESLTNGDKIIFLDTDTDKIFAGRVVSHYRDIEVIHAKTISKPERLLRLEYRNILEVL